MVGAPTVLLSASGTSTSRRGMVQRGADQPENERADQHREEEPRHGLLGAGGIGFPTCHGRASLRMPLEFASVVVDARCSACPEPTRHLRNGTNRRPKAFRLNRGAFLSAIDARRFRQTRHKNAAGRLRFQCSDQRRSGAGNEAK